MALDLIRSTYNPDVLTCLANLSSDEVFTPPEVVNQMLDMLPQDLFCNPDTTFLDPATKSGVFLREIAKRLMKGLEQQIPDLQERVDHIFKKQLFGIAMTELTSLLTRRSLYCSKYPNSSFSITKFETPEGNIRFRRINHAWKDGRCTFCGASQSEYDRSDDLETHAYEWIHSNNPKELWNMKFDVIISNPPYQLSDGGQKASATPIYQKFVQHAKRLNPRYITMIIPARWYSGGRGLDDFREEMLTDKRVRNLVDFTDANDCFPGVDIAGGVCYFLWDRDHEGLCRVKSIHNAIETETDRQLDEFDVFIRHSEALSIIEKINSKHEPMYNTRVSSQKPFGLRTYVKPNTDGQGDIVLRYNGGTGSFWRKDVTSSTGWIDKYKVIMSYLTYDHAGRPDKDGKRRIFSTMEVLEPGVVCTETYIVIDVFDTKAEAENLYKYLQTQLVRFLVAQMTSTQHISKASFGFVPVQDFTQVWTDAKLCDKYGISEDEFAFVDSMIRAYDGGETNG